MKCQRRRFSSPSNISVSQSIASEHSLEEEENRKACDNISRHVSQICTTGMWSWGFISFFPSQASDSPMRKSVGRRRMLSLSLTHSSFISGHAEEIRADLLVTASALEKGIYRGGWGEHRPTAATAQLTRVMRDVKLSEKSSAETLQGESNLCNWWCEFASRMTGGEVGKE